MKRGVKSVLESCVISILFWVSQVVEIKDEGEKFWTKKAFSFFCLYSCVNDTNAFVFRLLWIRLFLLYFHQVLLHNHLLLVKFSWLNEMCLPQSLTKMTGRIRFDLTELPLKHHIASTHYKIIPLSMLSNHLCSSSSGCELEFEVFSLQKSQNRIHMRNHTKSSWHTPTLHFTLELWLL